MGKKCTFYQITKLLIQIKLVEVKQNQFLLRKKKTFFKINLDFPVDRFSLFY